MVSCLYLQPLSRRSLNWNLHGAFGHSKPAHRSPASCAHPTQLEAPQSREPSLCSPTPTGNFHANFLPSPRLPPHTHTLRRCLHNRRGGLAGMAEKCGSPSLPSQGRFPHSPPKA